MTVRRHILVGALLAAAIIVLGCFLPSEPSGPRRVTFTLAFAQPYRLAVAGATRPLVRIVADGKALSGPTYHLESHDPQIVRVDSTGRGLEGVARGTATVRVVFETPTGTRDTTFSVRVIAARVAASAQYLTFTRLADTQRLTATAYDAKGTALTGVTFTWSSTDPRVASVDTGGVVKALNDGWSAIIAEADSVTGQASVNVAQVAAAVWMTPELDTLRTIGRSVEYMAVAVDSTDKQITTAKPHWSSSDTLVARVDTAGKATAMGAGTAAIVARVGTAADTATLVVAQVVRILRVRPSFDTLTAIADTVRHTALAFDSLNAPVPHPKVTWATGDTAVATVDSLGLVRAAKNGVTVVTASVGAQSDYATAVVRQEAASTKVSPDTVALNGAGDTVRLDAVTLDHNGYRIPGSTLTWHSNAECVATVSAGLVTARYGGTSTITATPENGARADTAVVIVGGAPCPAPAIAYVTPRGIMGLWPGADSGVLLVPNGERTFNEPSWSRDGGSLAFYGATSGWEDSDIFVAAADGSSLRALPDWPSDRNHFDTGPAWSPDKTRIAFVRSEGGENGTIAVADASGLNVRVLFSCRVYCGAPTWSRDGTKLAFTDADWDNEDAPPKIWAINSTDQPSPILLTDNGGDPAWSPDGSLIAFTRGSELWLMNSDGTNAHSVSTGDWYVRNAPPAWSPEGFRLVLSGWQDGSEYSDLFLINRDGSGLQRLTSSAEGAWYPAWRPPSQASGVARPAPTRVTSH